MSDRRYSKEEMSEIFLVAAERPERSTSLPASQGEGPTLAELQEIGKEVGLTPEAVAEAAHIIEVRGRGKSQTFMGLPIGVQRAVSLNRWLSDAEWEQLVVQLRDIFEAKGRVQSYGSLREWTNGNLQVLLEPTQTGHRIRLRTVKGGARASMTIGIGALIAAVGFGAVGLLTGEPASSFLGLLILMVSGLFSIGVSAIQLPRWARLRGTQMEEIALRLSAKQLRGEK